MRRARTGHNKRSSSRPDAKSDKDLTQKERGMERESDSDLATNCGTYERQASPPTKVTIEERACNSPTRLVVAKAKRNSTFCVRVRRGAAERGSKEEVLRNRRTTDRSQAGGQSWRSATSRQNDRSRSRTTGWEDKDGRWNLKTADSMER